MVLHRELSRYWWIRMNIKEKRLGLGKLILVIGDLIKKVLNKWELMNKLPHRHTCLEMLVHVHWCKMNLESGIDCPVIRIKGNRHYIHKSSNLAFDISRCCLRQNTVSVPRMRWFYIVLVMEGSHTFTIFIMQWHVYLWLCRTFVFLFFVLSQ